LNAIQHAWRLGLFAPFGAHRDVHSTRASSRKRSSGDLGQGLAEVHGAAGEQLQIGNAVGTGGHLEEDGEGLQIDAVLTYSLIPKPSPALLDGYLKTLQTDAERERMKRLIADYAEPRILTFRTKTL